MNLLKEKNIRNLICKSTTWIFLITVSLSIIPSIIQAQKVSGVVRDEKGEPLSFASVFVKDMKTGTACNNLGEYFLNLSPGQYTLICQHVGYKRDVRNITVGEKDIVVDFQLNPVDFAMEEVIVRSGENPANDIIRQTIKMRPVYQKELDKFTCEVYTKGLLRMRDYPKKVMGQKIEFDDGDTSKNQIIFLSETISTYAVDKPNNQKIEVHSSKSTGRGNNYGLAAPQFYSIYNNNVTIGENLNPRGFISPISDNATNYYKYKYEGSFFEGGKQISRIKVIPKRKFEPLFYGYINIVEDEWRIHSLRLEVNKFSQLEYLDTLRLEQVYVQYNDSLWVIHNQLVYASINFMGISAYGNFLNVYSQFDANPRFGKKYFDNTILKYTDSSVRKTNTYWEEARPMKLLEEETLDYRKKDSVEQYSNNPSYLDSVDRQKNKLSVTGILLTGQTFYKEKRHATYYFRPITDQINYNIVEGLTLNLSGTYTKKLDTIVGRKQLVLTPNLRYGFSNQHFNAWLSGSYIYGKKYITSINLSGGKRVFQFNNASPIGYRSTTISALFGGKNLTKTYEAWYLRGSYVQGVGEGLTWSVGFEYQNRTPLNNTTYFSFVKDEKKKFTPNYPTELTSENIKQHQAFSVNLGITWQPGARYIELPDQKINVGSKWPTMTLGYTRTFDEIVGSDVNYSRWRFSLTDVVRFKLAGVFNYRIGIGGFIHDQITQVPDYQHFNGNISHIATEYLNSFEILPIYEFSNTSKFYALAHIEHHLNGFLTNKIPGFRNLNWYLVTGLNTFYYESTNYLEYFVGLENILKNIRIDYYWARKDGKKFDNNFRVGFSKRFGLGRRNDD